MEEMGAAYYTPQPVEIIQYQYYQPSPLPLPLHHHPPPPGAAQPPPPPLAALPQPHPHPHHQFLQPLPYGAYVPQRPSSSSSSYLYTQPLPPPYEDVVRTLFVAGLPQDVKPREIYNLFREFPGYESSHLRSTGTTQPFAFVVFLDQQSAVVAMHTLNGFVFDLEKHSTLFIDLAKSNPRSKRPRTDDEKPGSEKRIKGSTAFSKGNPDSGLDSFHMPGTGNSASNTIGYPSTQSTGTYDGMIVGDNSAANLNSSKGSRVGTPCPTLFVANLAPNCTEEELIHVFSRCSGYLKLKMQKSYGGRVAFVDFQDTACSSEALGQLQGTIIYSSQSNEGMRLQFAKSRMGMRSKKSR